MNDGSSLLAAILANPACDTTRLVYADWIQESGQHERAEFICIQVELAKIMPAGRLVDGSDETLYRVRWLQVRERELWVRLRDGMRDETSPGVNSLGIEEYLSSSVGSLRCGFVRRGFIECVTCTAVNWLAHADAIVATHPVTKVLLTTEPHERDFGAIEKMDWAARTATYYRWPGIEFALPPA